MSPENVYEGLENRIRRTSRASENPELILGSWCVWPRELLGQDLRPDGPGVPGPGLPGTGLRKTADEYEEEVD